MTAEQELAVKAARQFKSVIDQIADDKWDMTMPAEFKTMSNEPTTLRETLNYHAYDDAWIPDMLAGKTMDEVGADKWKGDLLGATPAKSYGEYNDTAVVAIEKLDDPTRMTHLSFGDYTASDYLLQVISFRGFRAWDIARSVGLDSTLPDDLVQGMWDLLTPHADEWRKFGVYGPALPVPENATPQQRLLATLGFE